jgi:hypothetical protein
VRLPGLDPIVKFIVRVAVSKVDAGAREALKCSVTWHVLGEVIVPVQEFPSMTKSPGFAPGAPTVAAEKVTEPVPLRIAVTLSGALAKGSPVVGNGVCVGTPKERSPGDIDTVCARESSGIIANTKSTEATNAIRRSLALNDLMVDLSPGIWDSTSPCDD